MSSGCLHHSLLSLLHRYKVYIPPFNFRAVGYFLKSTEDRPNDLLSLKHCGGKDKGKHQLYSTPFERRGEIPLVHLPFIFSKIHPVSDFITADKTVKLPSTQQQFF